MLDQDSCVVRYVLGSPTQMYDGGRTISYHGLLLNDFFKHLHRKRRLRVFLCGRKPEHEVFDLRKQVKRLLESKMGCGAFLGEDIEEIRESTKVDPNLLTIEVGVARKCDLIVMFLGSAGTIAELTAFAMDKQITERVFVFNEMQYKDEKSFVNYGPLRLLKPEQIIYYEPEGVGISAEVIEKLDTTVARIWFENSRVKKLFPDKIGFEMFTTLACTYAAFPVRYEDVMNISRLEEGVLRDALEALFEHRLITKNDDKYVVTRNFENLKFGAIRWEMARARTTLMASRLRDAENISDYRLIVKVREGCSRLWTA